MRRLEGKSAIVTGAAHGLGRAIAERLANEGAGVLVADVRGEDAEAAAEALRDFGHRAEAAQVDVREAAQVDAMVRSAIDAFGSVDILVNNAGVGLDRPALETSEEEWDGVLGVNLKGCFLCCRAVAREMVQAGRGGRIVNITSTAGANARPGAAAYSASKAGIIQLTRVLALELGGASVTVNAVGPGMTITGSEIKPAPSESYQAAFVSQVAAGRPGRPEDIAQAVAYLVSPEAEYVTGQTLFVDGGYSAGKLTVRG